MDITYDRVADAAYISFGNGVQFGEATQQSPILETPNGQSQIIFDANEDGYLLGMEILHASAALHENILNNARQL